MLKMPSKETLKLPTIDVARTREAKVRDWKPPIPYFDHGEIKLNNVAGEQRKRPFRISLRPKYEHNDDGNGTDSLETKSLPPILTSRNTEKSVSIRRDGRGNFLVGNSFPTAPQTSLERRELERERPITPREHTYPFQVTIGAKRKPLAPIENMVEPKSKSTNSTGTSSSVGSSGTKDWSQSISHESLIKTIPKYISAPFKSQGPGTYHPRGHAPLKPEQVLVPSRRHEGCLEGCDGDNDWEWENLYNSITLPRIEAVLRAEGIKPKSISEQIAKIKERCRR